MMELTENDIAQMRRVARKKAKKLAWGHDDVDAASDDIEQDGWEAFIVAQQSGHNIEHCWFRAYSRMAERYFRWRFENRYADRRPLPMQGLDFSLLATLDPSVEEQVLGCELMRKFEDEFKRLRPGDRIPETFTDMILEGVRWGKNPDRYAKRGNDSTRRQRIKEMLGRFIGREVKKWSRY